MTFIAGLKKFWWHIPAAIRKPLILMIGSSIVVSGIAMLALPGPGWAAIFLGFAVLATEFAFAERVRDWLVGFLKSLIRSARVRWEQLTNKRKR